MLAFDSLSKIATKASAPSETTEASIDTSDFEHESNSIEAWCTAMQKASKGCKFLSLLSTNSGPSVKSQCTQASQLTIACTHAKQNKREKYQPKKPDIIRAKLTPLQGERFENELPEEAVLEEPLNLQIETKRDPSLYSDLSLNFKRSVHSRSRNQF